MEILWLKDPRSIPRTPAKWGKKPFMVMCSVGEMETNGSLELAGQPLSPLVSPRPARDPVWKKTKVADGAEGSRGGCPPASTCMCPGYAYAHMCTEEQQ